MKRSTIIRSGRAIVLASCLATAVTSVAAAADLPPDLWTRSAGNDWCTFLGPTGDGKSAETGLMTPWPADGPKLVWQQRIGVGYGMPAVSRGRLFQFDRHGDQARLTCQKAETMEELWRFEYPTDYEDMYGYDNGPRCMPIVDGERVYIFGAEGMLHCLTVADGAVVWKVDTKKDFGVIQNFFGVGSTPFVEGELLIVGVGGSPAESQNVAPGQLDSVKPNGSAVVAFDKLTGRVRYQVGDDLASYSSPTVQQVGDRRLGLYYARFGLLAFEPTTGKQLFHFPWKTPILESVNASNPVVCDDAVFISEAYGTGSALVKPTADGYEVVWQDELRSRQKRMETHWNTAVNVDGFLYGSSGRHTAGAELRCLEAKPGIGAWSAPGLSRSSLTYCDGHFICLTEYGELLLLKASTTKPEVVSQFVPTTGEPAGVDGEVPRLLTYPAWAAPTISHGLMFVRGHNRLACYEVIADKK